MGPENMEHSERQPQGQCEQHAAGHQEQQQQQQQRRQQHQESSTVHAARQPLQMPSVAGTRPSGAATSQAAGAMQPSTPAVLPEPADDTDAAGVHGQQQQRSQLGGHGIEQQQQQQQHAGPLPSAAAVAAAAGLAGAAPDAPAVPLLPPAVGAAVIAPPRPAVAAASAPPPAARTHASAPAPAAAATAGNTAEGDEASAPPPAAATDASAPAPPAAAAAAGDAAERDEVGGDAAKKYGEQHKLAKEKAVRHVKRAPQVAAAVTADLEPVKQHPNVMMGVHAKVISIAALPIHGSAFQCGIGGLANTSSEHADTIQHAVETLGRYLEAVNALEEVKGDLDFAVTEMEGAIAAEQRKQRLRARSAAASSSRGVSAARGHRSSSTAAAAATDGGTEPSAAAGAGPLSTGQDGLRSAQELADEPPTQRNQYIIRQLFRILRAHSLLPSSKEGYCCGGRAPGLQHNDAWKLWVVPASGESASSAGAAAAATVAAAAAAAGGGGASTAAGAAAVEGSGAEPHSPAAELAGAAAAVSAGPADATAGGGAAVCGCGNSCAAGRRLLSFPPNMPFVDYQKHDIVRAQQEALLDWAQAHGPQLPGAGAEVGRLMELYNQALELHAQRPRKQRSGASAWPARGGSQAPPAAAGPSSAPPQRQHGDTSAIRPPAAAGTEGGAPEPAVARDSGSGRVAGGVREPPQPQHANAAAAGAGVVATVAAGDAAATAPASQRATVHGVSDSAAGPHQDAVGLEAASQRPVCSRKPPKRHDSAAAAAAAAAGDAGADVLGSGDDEDAGPTPARPVSARAGRSRGGRHGRGGGGNGGRSGTADGAAGGSPLPLLLQPLPMATSADGVAADAAEPLESFPSSARRAARSPRQRRLHFSSPLEVGPGPHPRVSHPTAVAAEAEEEQGQESGEEVEEEEEQQQQQQHRHRQQQQRRAVRGRRTSPKVVVTAPMMRVAFGAVIREARATRAAAAAAGTSRSGLAGGLASAAMAATPQADAAATAAPRPAVSTRSRQVTQRLPPMAPATRSGAQRMRALVGNPALAGPITGVVLHCSIGGPNAPLSEPALPPQAGAAAEEDPMDVDADVRQQKLARR